ncbi:hypothetical protein [Amylibacter marinus]|uniref:hypothetical protein n=1 Tax=Amylibacter marinus TaxID=1475483 RepID=UPI0024E18482|nr:hypothetical protein [Amylibacter marinus]
MTIFIGDKSPLQSLFYRIAQTHLIGQGTGRVGVVDVEFHTIQQLFLAAKLRRGPVLFFQAERPLGICATSREKWRKCTVLAGKPAKNAENAQI